MSKSALIVVDVQNDFLTGTLALKNCPAKQEGEEVVEVINELTKLPGWDLIVFTMDWHLPDHISFITNTHKFKQHEESKVEVKNAELYDVVTFMVDDDCKRDQIMWPPHCIQGSYGAELHTDLKVPEDSHIVKKGVLVNLDSYSAFFDNERHNETELQTLLRSHEVEQTFVCGVATDVCVNYTVMDSVDLGFETYMIEDACRGVHDDGICNSINEMKSRGVHCIDSSEVSCILSGTKIENDTFITRL